ncbi:hypothetical protein QQS21_006007 [Conoideocrella luteorostrata]|uniref:Protein CAP22 n=1 Tax=Conoideocrella luteorostrata TaxID=1105319 RepID=A0AAJ0CRC3_9HYPO|nr:hypothetical protein QQS21_006007 [Conoideocrella luteorostrata]
MYSAKTLALALAPFLLAVNAKVDFDSGDAPNECKAICGPIGQLSKQCDVDLRSDIDRDENRLQSQCICTNKSFNVGSIAALCADCMHQSYNKGGKRDSNRADRDDLKDIDRMLATCGFSSTKYSPEATSQVQGLTVSASRPTDISQLTRTFESGVAQPTGTGTANTIVTRTDSTGGRTTITSAPATASGASQTGVATTTTRNAAALIGRDAAGNAMYIAGGLLVAGLMLE